MTTPGSEKHGFFDDPFVLLVTGMVGVFSLFLGMPVISVICGVIVWRKLRKASQ